MHPYANLLYKLGRKPRLLTGRKRLWRRREIERYRGTLSKMKKSEPTLAGC